MLAYFLKEINRLEQEIDYVRQRRFIGFDIYDLLNLIISMSELQTLNRVLDDYIFIYNSNSEF